MPWARSRVLLCAAAALVVLGTGWSVAQQAQQRSPSKPAVARDAGLPLFSTSEIEILKAQIERIKPAIEGREKRLEKRLAYLAKLSELLALAAEIRKEGADATSDLGPLLAPPWPALTIDLAVYGDLQHNHVCDATSYVIDKCKLRPANGNADDQNCLISSITTAEICGFDPSPQGFKQLYVEWSCGSKSQTPLRVPPAGPLRLVCHLHKMAGAQAEAEVADEKPKK